jgi:hypothetical protein
MPKQRTAAAAMKAVAEATEAVIQQGGVVHEDALWDASEMELDGASKEIIAERIKQERAEAYVPKGGWRARQAWAGTVPTSIMDEIERGGPPGEADTRHISEIREYAAHWALPLPVLFGMTAGIVGLLAYTALILASRS